MKRIALRTALLVALMLSCCPASADAAVSGDWGAYAAIASRFDVPLPDAYVHRSDCPDTAPMLPQGQMSVAACASAETGDVWIPDDALDSFTLAHELGHQFDLQYLTDGDREWLRRVMRAPGGDWFDYYGADEWFADYYADCATESYRHHTSDEAYADHPTTMRLVRVCNAITAWGLVR